MRESGRGTGEIWSRAPDEAALAERLRAHPAFTEAARKAWRLLASLYGGSRLPNAVLNDRGRVVGALAILYLHTTSDGAGGLTAKRFADLCRATGLSSRGRAIAFLKIMEFARYLERAPPGPPGRERRLVPTARLLAEQWRHWAVLYDALGAMLPDMPVFDPVRVDDALLAGIVGELGRRFLAGARLLASAPVLHPVVERKAGLLILSSLREVAETGGEPPSVSSLGTRFGVSRAQVRSIFEAAAASGLVSLSPSGTLLVRPALPEALDRFTASLFALLALGARSSHGRVGDDGGERAGQRSAIRRRQLEADDGLRG